ncbi:MAG: sigma-70 family RNA polymerase sigma factor [Planctomycetes bacterium]|nr:sigma-70 family RNA polymerase sigma factor [Planctomycetota bacterium]
MLNHDTDMIPDTELVHASQRGDEDCFEQLVLRYQYRLRGFVASYVHDADLADEIVQESFVRAYEILARFESERATFSSWLHGIARNVVREHRSRQYRRGSKLNDLQRFLQRDLEEREAKQAGNDPEQVEALRNCLSELDDNRKLIVRLRYYENHSVQDIARSIDRPPNTVSMILTRLRQSLRECVSRRLSGSPT